MFCMKKCICILLSLIMLLSMTACSENIAGETTVIATAVPAETTAAAEGQGASAVEHSDCLACNGPVAWRRVDICSLGTVVPYKCLDCLF